MKSRPIKILCVVGARPNFIKIAPLLEEMRHYPYKIKSILVHTGQHYDKKMSEEIFHDLSLPKPDVYLGIGSDSHAKQTSRIMIAFEDVVLKHKPDLVLVVGDVNSTLACALVAAKLHIPVAHIEAGLRSFNWKMPEEINRVLTDRLSDFLFTTEETANKNLIKEGISKDRIFYVGNVMIDTLKRYYKKSQKSAIFKKLNLTRKKFILLTMHRPETVDKKSKLYLLISIIDEVQKRIPMVFPIHPRTRMKIRDFKLEKELQKMENLILTEPLGYLDFLNLENNAKAVLTDSGGIQEETSALRIPCLTLREETERPATVAYGTNQVVGLSKSRIIKEVDKIMSDKMKRGKNLKYWDGKAAQRIVKILIKNKDKILSK